MRDKYERLEAHYPVHLVNQLYGPVMAMLGPGGLFEDADHLTGLVLVIIKLDLI